MKKFIQAIVRLLLTSAIGTLCIVPILIIVLVVSGDMGNSMVSAYLIMGAAVGFFTILIAGLPTHLLLQWRQWTGWRSYFLAGSAIPSVIVIAVHVFYQPSDENLLLQLLYFGGIGGLVAVVCRFIEIKLRT